MGVIKKMGEGLVLTIILSIPPVGVFGALGAAFALESKSRKREELKKEKRRELAEMDEKIEIYEKELDNFLEEDEIKGKMREINTKIYTIEKIEEEEQREISKNWKSARNEKIRESKKVIENYIKLKKDEKEVVKKTVLEILTSVEKEIEEMVQHIKNEKYRLLKEKYEQKLESMKNKKRG